LPEVAKIIDLIDEGVEVYDLMDDLLMLDQESTAAVLDYFLAQFSEE
jgi:hypothetical protein